MTNNYYDPSGWPASNAQASSYRVRDEMTAIEEGFDKFPVLDTNPDEVIFVNSSGAALEAKTAAQARALLGLVVGTDVQAPSDVLDALATLTNSADEIPRFTSATTSDTVTFYDEDNMASDDAAGVASQQSIKYYWDSQKDPLDGVLTAAANVACLYYNATAPTGWTIISGVGTYNNAVAVVDDTNGATTGGSVDLDSNITAGNQDASHRHTADVSILVDANVETQLIKIVSGSDSIAIQGHGHTVTENDWLLGTQSANHNHDWNSPAGAYCIIADKD